MDLHVLGDVLGEFFPILAVLGGEDDGLDAGATGGDGLFLDAADGEDLAVERDFAGHGEEGPDGGIEGQREEGGDHGDACGGAVLGGGALGDVHVDGGGLEEGGGGVEVGGDQVLG